MSAMESFDCNKMEDGTAGCRSQSVRATKRRRDRFFMARARPLASLVNTRGFGMTPGKKVRVGINVDWT